MVIIIIIQFALGGGRSRFLACLRQIFIQVPPCLLFASKEMPLCCLGLWCLDQQVSPFMPELLISQRSWMDGRKEAAGSSLLVTSGEITGTSDFMPVDVFLHSACSQTSRWSNCQEESIVTKEIGCYDCRNLMAFSAV